MAPVFKYAKNTKSMPIAMVNKKKQTLGGIFDIALLISQTKKLLFDPSYTWALSSLLFLAEIIVNVFVIVKIPYTEIDWVAYMEEVEGFVNGTYDYSKLEGATGPLVYPAGFVYIFTGLYYITDYGRKIRMAQWIFAGLYLTFLIAVFFIYQRSKVIPPYVMFFMCCASYRIHSIFILRMFNDPVAMFFLYLAICCFIEKWWNVGCILFSLAVSVKMNVLLFAPGLLVILLITFGIPQTILKISLCAIIQLILALPFLMTNPTSYIVRSFDLGRQFFFKWTVNWRFLPEWLFLNRYLHVGLLLLHISCLLVFFAMKWPRPAKGWSSIFSRTFQPRNLDKIDIIKILFTANFIGICFARSLHYQFYVWYFHTLPFLLWSTDIPTVVRILILGVLELCWNTYPSTISSSLSLHICHAVVLAALYFSMPRLENDNMKSGKKKKT